MPVKEFYKERRKQLDSNASVVFIHKEKIPLWLVQIIFPF